MTRFVSFFAAVYILLGALNASGKHLALGRGEPGNLEVLPGVRDTTIKPARMVDRFSREKQFTISTIFRQDSSLPFKKGDVIRISTGNGLRHYRNKQLLNTYKIIPQLAIITIQPQCRAAPCPPIEVETLVYHLGSAARFIDIRNNKLLVSEEVYQDATAPGTALRIAWLKSHGLIPRNN